MTRGRDHDWASAVAREARRASAPACRSRRPIRSTSSTPPARPASRRAWCATMAAMRSRCTGRCRTIYGVEPGEVFWAASDVGWVVGHSYIVYAPLLHGCTTVLYEGKPVGTPDAGAFWRVIAEHGVAALFTAPTAFRAIKQEDPDGKLIAELRPVAASARCSSPASAPIPTRQMGRATARRAGHRPLVADRDRLADRRATRSASACCRSSTARRPCRCPATTSRCWTTPASRSRPGTLGNIAMQLPLPPGCLPTLWNDDERFRAAYLARLPGLLQDRRRRLHRRGRLSSTSWAAPTTSSTSPATGSRPAAWRRCWRRIPTSPNAP